jgi:hypothetical protein
MNNELLIEFTEDLIEECLENSIEKDSQTADENSNISDK